MMNDPYQKLLLEVGIMRRRMANADRFGQVTHVDGDRIRMQWGTDVDGKPCLSPWIATSDHRGGNTEQHVYKVGQNVRMSSMNGDYSMATVTHWAPSQGAPAPDNAESGAHTQQNGENRISNKSDAHDTSLNKGDEGKMRIEKGGENGVIHRYGKDMRCVINKDEVLIKAGGNTIHVDKKGCWSSSPLKIKKAKTKDNNN